MFILPYTDTSTVRFTNRLMTLLDVLLLRSIVFVAFAGVANSSLYGVVVETVSVEFLNNPGDPESGFGTVDGFYRIGTYEVTNSQYVEFLNSVAATDTHGLFHENMTIRRRGGIERDGDAGEYTYYVKEHFEDKPVIWVNLWDAARFVNWLHNGQPSGDQTTETTESGAYDLRGLDPNVDSIEREKDATWFLPTVDEWYKAAYYQPPEWGGDVDGYWAFATATNDFPTCAQADNETGDIANPGANVVNYMRCADWNGTSSLPSPGNVTTVGSAGEMSRSFFGTYDQSGNVAEWIEPPYTTDDFAVLGGLLFSDTAGLEAPNARFVISSTLEANAGGFRVARIAKPMIAGDFNEDRVLDTKDIDMLSEQIIRQDNDPFFDLNGDSAVNQDELQIWVKEGGCINSPSGL